MHYSPPTPTGLSGVLSQVAQPLILFLHQSPGGGREEQEDGVSMMCSVTQ